MQIDMNDCAANCPFCNSAIEFSIDLLDTIVLCPVCQEEICLSKNDIIDFSEAKRREEKFQQEKAEIEKRELLKLKQLKEKKAEIEKRELLKLKQLKEKQERSRTEYRFIVLKFEDVETTLNHLWHNEGWQVVAQSTVFLSETSASWGGLGGGTKTEGIAYTLKREKDI